MLTKSIVKTDLRKIRKLRKIKHVRASSLIRMTERLRYEAEIELTMSLYEKGIPTYEENSVFETVPRSY